MKVSVSVTDLPILLGLEQTLAVLKNSGADGMEIVPGIKSRWSFSRLKELSDEYDLSITSVHQPPWSIAGLFFDEGFIVGAHKIGVKTIVFHPTAKYSFEDEQMVKFLKRLSDLQDKYSINVLLENMPWVVRPALLRKVLPYHSDSINPQKVAKAALDFGLGMTFDTSHAFLTNPQDQEWFSQVYPTIKNIHLSSFENGRDHLPLDMGEFNTKGFIKSLRERQYQGLVTLEIYYPKKFTLREHDFDSIKRSIQLVKNN